MENGLIEEGLILMVVGMGTVFVFLSALVVVMTLMSRLLATLRLDLAVPEAASAKASPGGEEIAAIAAAIRKHRNQ